MRYRTRSNVERKLVRAMLAAMPTCAEMRDADDDSRLAMIRAYQAIGLGAEATELATYRDVVRA